MSAAISISPYNTGTVPTPGTKPSDPSLAGKSFRLDGDANAVEIWGTIAGGTGTAWLARFHPEGDNGSGAWYEELTDAASGGWTVNSGVRGGRFHTKVPVPEKVGGDYIVLFPADATATELFANARNY